MTYTGNGLNRVLRNLLLGLWFFTIFLILPPVVSAHPGNTDAYGCHTCRTNCSSWGLSYGEYHCHNPKSSYTAPSTPSCPLMSSYNSLSGSCECFSGYVVEKNFLGTESCVSASSKCMTDFGYGSEWNSLSKKCECSSGYVVSNNKCISGSQYCSDLYGYNSSYDSITDKCECRYGYLFSGGKCVSESSYCSDLIGLMSRYNSITDKCECMVGYEYNGSSCVYKKSSITWPSYTPSIVNNGCPLNSHTSVTDSTKCTCNDGYQVDSLKTSCTLTPIKSNEQICQDSFGINVIWDGTKTNEGLLNCNCKTGYQWNQEKTSCFVIPYTAPVSDTISPAVLGITIGQDEDAFVQSQINAQEKTDTALVKRLSGRILLQTESHGEAWYIEPATGRRYYLKNGQTAYEMLRTFGLGISNSDLQKLQKGDNNLKKKLSGRIILQVESHGEAYYVVPTDGSVRYLKHGDDAYQVMRELGLGIKNSDLNHIPISKFISVKK